MVTKDLKELEQYRPIKSAGGDIIWYTGGTALMYWLLSWYFHLVFLRGSITPSDVIGMSFASVLAVAFIGCFWFDEVCRRQNPMTWFKDYWRRNVVSYYATFWLADGNLWAGVHRNPNYAPADIEEGRPFITVPLGGWFKRVGWVLTYGRVTPLLRNILWTITLARHKIAKDEVFQYVTLMDRKGQQITIQIEQALRFFVHCFWHELSDSVTSLCYRFDGTIRERDEAKKHVEEAINIMDEAIGRIDDTQRFIESKQAKEIRQWLVRHLLARLPFGDPRRVPYDKEAARSVAV